MAQVPYVPFSTAQPASPGEKLNVATPDAAFGVNVGHAVEHAGVVMTDEVGKELYGRATALQELNNETMAREQAVKTTQGMAERYEQFKALGQRMGEPGQLQALYKDIETMRQQGRNSLPNAHAQRMFDAEAASLQNRVTMAGAATAGDAFKGRVTGSAEAQMDLASRQWVDPRDEKEVQQKADSIRRGVDTIAGVHGFDAVQTKDLEFKKISNLRLGQLNSIAITDSTTALDMLDSDEMKKQMTQADYDTARKFAMARNLVVGAEFVAKKVYDPNKTLEEMQDEVRAIAPKYAHGDETFVTHALAAVQKKDWFDRRAVIEGQQRAKDTVDAAIGTFKYHSVQEMSADPQLAVAINQQKPIDINNTEKRLFQAFKDRDYEMGKPNFDKLRGMAIEHPAAFLNEDLYAYRLNGDQRNALLLMRKAITNKQPAADPQVQKAAAAIRIAYPHSIPTDTRSDAYLTFLGSLQGLMEDVGAQKGRKLGLEDFKEMGKALVQEVPKSGFFSNYKVFDEPVPDAVYKSYKDRGMNDDEITQDYHRNRAMQSYNELFGGAAKPKPK